MSWRMISLLVGTIVAIILGWELTPYLRSLWVIQTTAGQSQILANGWELLRTPALSPLIAVGVLIGWFVGRLEGQWTGSLAAEADLRTDREAMEAETASQAHEMAQERQNLEQDRAQALEAHQMAQQAQQEADAAKAEAITIQVYWKKWATQEVAQAKAEMANAQKRSRNAIGTAERRKRKLDRVLSERPHTA